MKAKMPNKTAEPGQYLCFRCWGRFWFESENEKPECPRCGNDLRQDMVPIYVENDPREMQLYTEDDWHGG